MTANPRSAAVVLATLAVGCGGGGEGGVGGVPTDAGADVAAPRALEVLLFTRTLGYRHASIANAKALFENLPVEERITTTHTEDPSVFTDAGLSRFDAVLFANTTGDVLDEEQQEALRRFVEGGKAWVGTHSAADTEYDWPFYRELAGAWFKSHPLLPLPATLTVEDRTHPSTAHLEATFDLTDEWYNFRDNPRERVAVLMTVDEADFTLPNTDREPSMGGDHPIAWHREVGAGRTFYTALGHVPSLWSEPLFVRHLLGGLRWAAR